MRFVGFLLALSLLPACRSALAAPCANPDDPIRVTGQDECLVAHSFASSGALATPTLVVAIHGDVSGGGQPAYIVRLAKRIATEWGLSNLVAVGLVRPGYEDGAGAASTGDDNGRRDAYTAHNIDAVADAVSRLKTRHKAGRAILVGHSGGAAIAAVILGRHPGLADGAVLAACPCDIGRWVDGHGWRSWTQSESPDRYVGRVPATARVVAVNGRNDDVTGPELTEAYIASLKARGIEASAVLPDDAPHRTAIFHAAVRAAITSLVSTR